MKGFVCCEHFQEKDFRRKNKSELKKGSVPTIFEIWEPNIAAWNSMHSPQPLQHLQAEKNENIIRSEDPSTSQEGQEVAESTELSESNINSAARDNEDRINPLNHRFKQCSLCCMKDELIEKYKNKIEKLEKKLLSARNKAYFLEKVKQKLTNTLSEMKQNKLIDEKQWETLKVTVATVNKTKLRKNLFKKII